MSEDRFVTGIRAGNRAVDGFEVPEEDLVAWQQENFGPAVQNVMPGITVIKGGAGPTRDFIRLRRVDKFLTAFFVSNEMSAVFTYFHSRPGASGDPFVIHGERSFDSWFSDSAYAPALGDVVYVPLGEFAGADGDLARVLGRIAGRGPMIFLNGIGQDSLHDFDEFFWNLPIRYVSAYADSALYRPRIPGLDD